MDWKKENPKNRYIDDLTNEEASHIAWLSHGQPKDFVLLEVIRSVNDNNIPHVTIKCRYYESFLKEDYDNQTGIFHNLNVYIGEHFHKAYCQKEVFDYFKQIGLE